MPNWCENEVDVIGTLVDRVAFADFIVGEEECDGKTIDLLFSFNKILPRPPKIDWYTWNVNNWGCKWEANNIDLVVKDKRHTYMFLTAWSPPSPVLRACARAFPQLRFTHRYWECGIGFRGWDKYKDGVMVDSYFTDSYRGSRGG